MVGDDFEDDYENEDDDDYWSKKLKNNVLYIQNINRIIWSKNLLFWI